MARRVKKVALDVPQTQAEGVALVAEYAEAERRIRHINEVADKRIAQATQSRDAALALVAPAQADRFARIKSWWEVSGHTMAGKRRSTDVAGVKLGFRVGQPKLKLEKGETSETIVDRLRKWADEGKLLRRFVNMQPALNRKAIIAARADADVRAFLAAAPLKVEQVDEFFIEAGPTDGASKEAEEPEG